MWKRTESGETLRVVAWAAALPFDSLKDVLGAVPIGLDIWRVVAGVALFGIAALRVVVAALRVVVAAAFRIVASCCVPLYGVAALRIVAAAFDRLKAVFLC